MTRKQAIQKIAEARALVYSLGQDDLIELIKTGHIGICEMSNTELEEQYHYYCNKQIKIK